MAVPFLRLIVGEFGTGKSLRLLEHGLELAEKYHKGLVTNFPINLSALRKYCLARNYRWIISLISFNQIKYLPILSTADIYKILEYRNKVILFDEAGIFLNARSWSKVPDFFLASLVQVRKDGNFFLLACHFLDQVDKQLRENCQYFIECRSVAFAGRRPVPLMVLRWWYEFKPAAYNRWNENPQWQNNFFRTCLASSKQQFPKIVLPFRFQFVSSSYSGLLNFLFHTKVLFPPSYTSLLFDCFDSSQRLDKLRKNRKYTDKYLGLSSLPSPSNSRSLLDL